jgi:hypothetical protein
MRHRPEKYVCDPLPETVALVFGTGGSILVRFMASKVTLY